MYLKKAFQLQNLIKTMIAEFGYTYLNQCFYVETVQEHKKSVLNKYLSDLTTQFEDEIKNTSNEAYGKYDLEVLIKVFEYLLQQQAKLTTGIAKAKALVDIDGMDYDTAVINAKSRRNLILDLKSLLRTIPEVPKVSERNTGVSFSYKDSMIRLEYPVIDTASAKEGVYEKLVETIDKLAKEAEELSDSLEQAVMTTCIPKEYEVEITSDTTLAKLYNKFANK
jgi:hypothetical protein